MPEIDVHCEPAGAGWVCEVRVRDNGSDTHHRVAVSRGDLARLASGAGEPTDLVRRSFVFLLERESAQSILRSFDLPLIGRYFPEYEATIRES